MRYLFFLLILANLGYWGWHQAVAQPKPLPPTRVIADVPPLLMLSEREAGELMPEPETQPDIVAVADDAITPGEGGADRRCFTIGPYRTSELANAVLLAIREEQGFPVTLREREEEEIAGYWVYLEPYPTRKAALAVARELAQKGIKDYYVVPSGESVNAVSLGLFSEPQRADRRTRQIAELGYEALTTVRYRTRTLYWLDYDEVGEAALAPDVWSGAAGDADAVQRISRECGEIAGE